MKLAEALILSIEKQKRISIKGKPCYDPDPISDPSTEPDPYTEPNSDTDLFD